MHDKAVKMHQNCAVQGFSCGKEFRSRWEFPRKVRNFLARMPQLRFRREEWGRGD